jgi:polysaccharide biosynthesis transport protein
VTYSHLLLLLKARWRTVLLVMLAAASIPLLAALLLPKRYTATASVVLDVKSPDPIAGVVLPGMTVSGYMATQVDVLQSERVALRAIQALQLADNPTLRNRWRGITQGRGNFQAWVAETVLRGLDVRPSRDSNVIAVAYTSEDPEFSAALANAFVRAYIDTTLELRVEPARLYNSFFDERAKAMRDALEQAQARLSAYQRQNGILNTDERLDIENQRLAEISSQLVAIQAVVGESTSRQQQVSGNTERLQEVLNSPLVAGLTTELIRQEARLDEMKSQRGDQHPQVLELRASIAQLRSRVESETRRVAGSLSVNNDVNLARMAQLRATLQEQRAKLLRLKGQRDEATVLQREVENAQRAYDGIQARSNQSSMESQNTLTNVSVLKNASVPPFHSSPNLSLIGTAALVLGVLLSLGAVLVREKLDRRIRSEDDVLLALSQPLLGVMPARRTKAVAAKWRLPLLGRSETSSP